MSRITKINKKKKAKQYKCYYCKNYIPKDLLVEWEGKTGIKYRACQPCRQERLDRAKFFQYYCEALDIPKSDKKTVMTCDKWKKDGYSYSVILHALKSKENEVKKFYKTKGVPYIMGIIRNQLNLSYKILKDKKLAEKEQQLLEQKNNQKPSYYNYKYKAQQSKGDISEFL